jgi:cytochrome c5
MKRIMTAITAVVFTVLAGSAYTQDTPPKAASAQGTVRSITLPEVRIELKEGEGRVKTESHCNICHSVDYITMQPKFPRAQWNATVNKMIKTFGAPVPQEDAEKIINYLSANYGTGS